MLVNNIIDYLKQNEKVFVYYSNTKWNFFFKRPQYITKYFNNSYLKIFITSNNIFNYKKKYNLLIVPSIYKDIVFNNHNNISICYNDNSLFEEIIQLKKNNKVSKIIYDFLKKPMDSFNLKNTIDNSDIILYNHQKLLEILNNIDNTKEYHYISNGCDIEHFSRSKERIYPKPIDIPETDKPILGYYGKFSQSLDYNLIRKYADEDKYHILMIGMGNHQFEHKNVTWLSHKNYQELPIYLSWFDVCFLPYKKCETNTYKNPCKLLEYMASGKEIIKIGINIEFEKNISYLDICEKLYNIIGSNNITNNSENDNYNNIIKEEIISDWDIFNKIIINSNYYGIYIILNTIPWNTALYQRPQHLALSMSNLNYFVIYTSHYIKDDRFDKKIKYKKIKYKKIKNNLWITNDFINIYELTKAYFVLYSTINMNYLETLKKIKKNKNYLIYEYIDHIDPKIDGSIENCNKLNNNKLNAFSGKCDLIIASADLLMEDVKKNSTNVDSLLVKNGVCVKHFIDKKNKEYFFNENINNFRNNYKIIIGYYGAIAPWLDYNLINNIVEKRQDIGFIFIGPDYLNSLIKLKEKKNLLYLGSINYKLLPYYGYLFDICFIPFEEGEISKTTSPLKLYEYFSMEKPIIVTSYMLECIQFDFVLHDTTVDGISNKINDAILLINDIGYKKKALKIAYENDWDNRASDMIEKFKYLKYNNSD
jgi:teichuronic acid biosynthesis glycosyltransferase TuaH